MAYSSLVREMRGESVLIKNGRHLDRDRQLQLSRRIDWRFLLPNPQLHQVAFLGPGNSMLLNALNHFSESLTVISPSNNEMSDQSSHSDFELVVLQSYDLADLEQVSSKLKANGFLYWEIYRKNWSERLRLRHFRSYIEAVEQLGYRSIQVSWHRPDFDSCLEIIPLNKPIALHYVFSRQPANVTGQIKMAVGRILTKLHLLPRLVPYMSITARKGLETMETA